MRQVSAFDRALLRADTAAPIRVDILPSLPPAQLALASLRPDLDVFLRQRAHVEFLMRRSRYRKSDKRDSQEQPLLDHTLDFPLPDLPSTLTPTELVLVQFNRRCTSLDWADDAAQLFLSRARAAQADDEGAQAQGYMVRRCEMVCDGGAWVDEQGVTLQVEPDALVVGRAGEVLFKIDPCAMTGTRRFAGRPGDGDEVELEGFEVEAERVVLDKVGATVTNVKLTFELARAGENGALLAAVASWSRTGGFRVGPKGDLKEQQVAFSSAHSTSRPRAASNAVLGRAASGIGAAGSVQSQKDRSQESRRKQCVGEGPWKYVDVQPEGPGWHPGELLRQMALLRAISPKVPLAFVTFTLDDLALLSRRSSMSKLPRLPVNPPEYAAKAKYVAVERLALEHIYRGGARLSLSTERLVLLTPTFPALREYAKVSSKLVDARDALAEAYKRVMGDLGQRGASVKHLVELLRGMLAKAMFRRQVLYTADGRLIRSVEPTFSEAELGKDVYERFERALGEIVRDEERAGSVG